MLSAPVFLFFRRYKEMESDRLIVGIKQSLKAIELGKASKAYIAADAEISVTGKVIALCKAKQIPIEYVPTMKELGEMCSISVGASCAVICSI